MVLGLVGACGASLATSVAPLLRPVSRFGSSCGFGLVSGCFEGPRAEPLDRRENVVGRLDPAEGLGIVAGAIDTVGDRLLQLGGRWRNRRRANANEALCAILPNRVPSSLGSSGSLLARTLEEEP